MNNPLRIPVAVLPGPLPAATVISAAELAARQDIFAAMEAERAAARDDADALRRQAQAELEQARLDADALREAARREGERQAALAEEPCCWAACASPRCGGAAGRRPSDEPGLAAAARAVAAAGPGNGRWLVGQAGPGRL
ncbi:hypothetical protein ABD440_19295, partial [Chromobacterium piscinae]|uniref:hypothetical protein n=1 Tax=Chromobacterium piscinae TaxID=686831 RepID=UPI0031FE2C7F